MATTRLRLIATAEAAIAVVGTTVVPPQAVASTTAAAVAEAITAAVGLPTLVDIAKNQIAPDSNAAWKQAAFGLSETLDPGPSVGPSVRSMLLRCILRFPKKSRRAE